MSKIEKEEIEILISLNKHINNKNYDYLILNNFLNKFIKNLYIRSINDISKLRFIFKHFIEQNIINLKNDISVEKKEEVENILKEIFIKDTSIYENEKNTFIKYIYNNVIKKNYNLNPDIKHFKYCKVIETKLDIPLSDIVIFTKNDSFEIIEDVNNIENLWFVLNKNLVINFSNLELSGLLVEKELYDFIIRNAKDFIITTKELSQEDIKNMESFDFTYNELHEKIEDIICKICIRLLESKVDEYNSIIKNLLISFEK